MRQLLSLVLAVALIQVGQARFPKDSSEWNPFIYWKDRISCPETPNQFPTSYFGISNYQSIFSDNPSPQELYANIDTETEGSKFSQALKDIFSHRYIQEVIPGKIYQCMHFALGYPAVYITPEDTLIVIDAPESALSGQECLAELRKVPVIGTKPIVAMVYTIYHADHIFGAEPFMKDPYNNGQLPVIIAHSNLLFEAYRHDTFKGFKIPRSFRMFGVFLPDPPHMHDGSAVRVRAEGPLYITYNPQDLLYFPDTDTVLSRTIGGLEFQFVSIPGYTSDQIIVWCPSWKVLHCSDAYYEMFPNLYTLRGEPGRDVLKWAEGTRKTASFDSDILICTHCYPKFGLETIRETLNNYADAIQFLHDQTVRYMTKGYPPDIIPRVVNLPEEFSERDYLKMSYAIEDTAIKGIFDFYVGWFSGLVEDLFPVDRFERGEKLIKMVGPYQMRKETAEAYNKGEYEWALELASYLWRNDETDRFALDIRTECLKRLGEVQTSTVARNYLFSTIMEDWDLFSNVVDMSKMFIVLHLDGAMKNLQFHLNDTAVAYVRKTLYLHLTDINVIFKLSIRNSILDYVKVEAAGNDAPTLKIKDSCDLSNPNDVLCWRFMLAGYVPFTAGEITNGTPEQINEFFSYFDWVDEQEHGYEPEKKRK